VVYCTCSLEPEEGEGVVTAVLADRPEIRLKPISDNEISGLNGFVTPRGELRTLPCGWPDENPRMAGLDGFYAARLERI
jgi:16S rRNA (cytosine967-C5)-methyltransferase